MASEFDTVTRAGRATYNIYFSIKGDDQKEIDLTLRVNRVMLLNSINSPYSTFFISFHMDSKDTILNKIHGQTNAKIKIILSTEKLQILEEIDVDLIIAYMQIPMSVKQSNPKPEEPFEEQVNLVAFPRIPFLNMTTVVNKVFGPDQIKQNSINTPFSSGLLNGNPISEFLKENSNFSNSFKSIFSQMPQDRLNNININQIVSNISSIQKSVKNIGNEITTNETSSNNINSLSSILNNFNNDQKNISSSIGGIQDFINNTKDVDIIKGLSSKSQDTIEDGINGIKNNVSNSKNFINELKDGVQGIFKNNNSSKSDFLTKNLTDNNIGGMISGTSKSKKSSYNGKGRAIDFVECICNDFTKNAKIILDDNNCNTDKIKQSIIPPMPLIKSLRFIDDNNGIFKGPSFIYHSWDNEIHIRDLSKSIEKEPEYTVHFLSLDQDASEIISKSASDDKIYYTYNNFINNNSSNINLMKKSYSHQFINKPVGKFYETITHTLDTIAKELAPGDGEKNFMFNEELKNRITVHSKGIMGGVNSTNNSHITSKLAGFIANSSSFYFKLEGSTIPIKNLCKLGIPVNIVMYNAEYIPMGGKYVSTSNIINFSREIGQHYKMSSRIYVNRQNIQN